MTNDGRVQVVRPGADEARWILRSSHPLTAGQLDSAIAEVLKAGGGDVDLWIEAVETSDDLVATAAGFEAYRELWQLRCPLPAAATDLQVRTFLAGDADDFLRVNNQAFHWHPEQGSMTHADLAARQAEDWFDAQGFLIYEAEGRMAGFCWTKVHPDSEPPMGEIYVIAVDPDFHGRGLGSALTLAGLGHLADRGLTLGMLYVESDNGPANAVYERIGFTQDHADRVYTRTVTTP